MVVVTIDGPAGAGKSTIARKLAEQLQFQYLDTGAMYRALVVAALRDRIDMNNESELVNCCLNVTIEMDDQSVKIDGVEVSDKIREPEIAKQIRHVADHPDIRNHLVDQQRRIASQGNFVCEGRDQGTVAFPDADCKIFLTASASERAKRRQRDLLSKGIKMPLEQIQADQDQRDQEDYSRPVGRLQKADDASEISTDGLSIEQVVEELVKSVNARGVTVSR